MEDRTDLQSEWQSCYEEYHHSTRGTQMTGQDDKGPRGIHKNDRTERIHNDAHIEWGQSIFKWTQIQQDARTQEAPQLEAILIQRQKPSDNRDTSTQIEELSSAVSSPQKLSDYEDKLRKQVSAQI